jgi:hypothetical protein
MSRSIWSAAILCLCLILVQGAATSVAGDKERFALVSVAGAPGDGERTLAAALARRLAKAGITTLNTPEIDAYEIQGMVKVVPGAGKMEDIQIIWIVFDPDGNQIGVVSQSREVFKGAFDRKWGAAADVAAEAAADEILPLLKR